MPQFYALVDAVTGREPEVEAALRHAIRVLGATRCKEKNHDFLVKFEALDFAGVDDYLQTHIGRIPGVASVEIVVDWADHGQATLDAKEKLG